MKKIFSTILAIFAIGVVSSAPINEEQARRIAIDFFSGGTRAGAAEVELAWAGSSMQNGPKRHSVQASASSDDALLYIYNRSDSPGFVILAGDDNVRPVVAFSYEQRFDTENMAPAARAMLSAWCEKVAEARLLTSTSAQQKLMPAVGVVECDHKTALWNQEQPFNNEAPVYQGYRSVTGCVATAMSIIAYYHKWPEKGVGTTPSYTYADEWGITRTIPANTLGRKYDYNNMLHDYTSSYTTTQGNAVAALMYDMGTSVEMAYSPSASGAISTNVQYAFATFFGYSKSCQLIYRGSKSDNEWFDILKTNIATYGPTYFSGNDTNSGHAFVLDGYTSGNYFHINYGWSGAGNGYYWIPEIEYFNDQDALLYLEPDKNGTSTYTDYLALISAEVNGYNYLGLYSFASEYKTNQPFTILIGGISNQGIVDFSGDIMVAQCDKNGKTKSAVVTANLSNLPARYYTRFNPVDLRITSTIEEGDRLRLLYKGAYSSDWQWARTSDAACFDEILLKATPEEVAKSLSVSYSKSAKSLTFTSSLAIQYTVKGKDGSTKSSGAVAALNPTTIDLSSFAAGEYLLEFTSGGRPYVLTIVL